MRCCREVKNSAGSVRKKHYNAVYAPVNATAFRGDERLMT